MALNNPACLWLPCYRSAIHFSPSSWPSCTAALHILPHPRLITYAVSVFMLSLLFPLSGWSLAIPLLILVMLTTTICCFLILGFPALCPSSVPALWSRARVLTCVAHASQLPSHHCHSADVPSLWYRPAYPGLVCLLCLQSSCSYASPNS